MSSVYFTRRCRGIRGSLRMYKHLCKAPRCFAERVEPLCDKVTGRFFSQITASGVMKFLSLTQRNILKTGRSFVSSKDDRGRERKESEASRTGKRVTSNATRFKRS